MKKTFFMRSLVWLLAITLAVPVGGFAQSQEPAPVFRQEELDQMLAPIALYPDELLAQVLMAATYPLEIVEAARWTKANPNLKGDQLADALEKQNWDPSVKSLANFPSVLAMMSEKLQWTQKLGDAFLSQEAQVMDTVQNLRNKAYDQGNLKTTSEQKVIVQEKTIVIEPASPQVVYVPAYSPAVYGPWWYPSYPPYSYYPPGYTLGSRLFAFGAGLAIGAAWGYAWGGFNWGRRDVNINIYKNVNINKRINRNYYANKYGGRDQGRWQHDASHRKGVMYRDQNTRQKYGQARPGAENRRDYRGRPSDTRDRPGAGRDQITRDRPSMDRPSPDRGKDASGRDFTGKDRPGRDAATRDRPTAAQTRDIPQRDRKAMEKQERRSNAFESIDRSPKEIKMARDRGNASRQSMSKPAAPRGGGSMSRPSSGGARGGGGGGRGGGRRGR
jgi:hypothetical protein